jgi:hypothetical protein
MKINGKVIQHHHVMYQHKKEGNKRQSQREVILPVYMYEHKIISDIQKLKPENCSEEFWYALRVLDAAYSPFAHNLRDLVATST